MQFSTKKWGNRETSLSKKVEWVLNKFARLVEWKKLFCCIFLFFKSNFFISYVLTTLCEVLWWELSRSVTKNLTAYRLNSGVWGLDDMKREIHSFPTMYIMGGGKWCRNGSKLRFSQKKWPKNSFLEWHKSGSTDFGGVWHPYFWRYRYFPHVFWKIWSMIFELSYVQGVNLR